MVDSSQWIVQHGRDPRILGRLRLVLVGDQFGLNGDADELVDRLHGVLDRGDAALASDTNRVDTTLTCLPTGDRQCVVRAQCAGPHVQNPFMLEQVAVPHVERLVVDEQPHAACRW